MISTLTSTGCFWLSEGSIGYFSLILILGGIAFGNFLAIPPSMVADVIDWDEVETGKRREGNYFAIWAFTTKLGAAVTGFIALQVLEHVGYVPNVPQTDTVKLWLLIMFSWFPAICYLLSAITLLRFRFDADELSRVQEKLDRA